MKRVKYHRMHRKFPLPLSSVYNICEFCEYNCHGGFLFGLDVLLYCTAVCSACKCLLGCVP